MTNTILYILWGGLFALCAGLGFIPEPVGAGRIALMAAAILFFVPPVLLVIRAWNKSDSKTLKLIRNLCAVSLLVTLVLLIAVFAAIPAPLAVGDVIHGFLVILSSPMVCGQSWILSLGLWAALMWTCILMLRRIKAG